MPQFRLTELLDAYGFAEVDVLKIDTEGDFSAVGSH